MNATIAVKAIAVGAKVPEEVVKDLRRRRINVVRLIRDI